jgi:3-hydroxyisobutyrate dehydrogenase
MARIGFVGLGHMGLPMALNLIKAGHHVTGFDLNPQAIASFTARGGLAAKTLFQVADHQDIIITMLQTAQQVKEVCLAQRGLFDAATHDTLWIDCSSIDVQSTRDLHQQAESAHLKALDAPVSGGVAGATAGTLTFMVGGEKNTYNAAKSILSHMGKTIIYTGHSGSGQAAKICNNMILGVSMIAVSEAFVLAKKLGLTPQKLAEVVTNSSGQCWVMSHYVPVADVLDNVPANRDYEPGFTSAMMLKDLHLSQHAAEGVGIQTPMAAQATELYQQFNEAGMGAFDFSAIVMRIDDVR